MAEQPISKGTGSRVSLFIETPGGFKGYIEVAIGDVPEALDADGNPMTPLDALYAELTRLDAVLTTQGYKRDASFDKPAPRSGGGGGGRPAAAPAAAPPAGVPVPMHCGIPCEFKPSFTSPRTHKAVGAKYQCAAGNACPDKATTGYPWSVFLDSWKEQQGVA